MSLKYLSGVAALLMLTSCVTTQLSTEVPANSHQDFDRVLDSVVALVEDTPEGLVGPTCSAFFVSETDLVTAAHCVTDVEVSFSIGPDGPQLDFDWQPAEQVLGKEVGFMTREDYADWLGQPEIVRARNPRHHTARVISIIEVERDDVALLRISGDTPRSQNWLRIRDWSTEPPQAGQTAYALGMPVGELWILTRGIISGVEILPDNMVQLYHDARIGHGSSGSPVMDEYGRVLGVNVQISRENIFSKASPSSLIKTLYRLYETRIEIEHVCETNPTTEQT